MKAERALGARLRAWRSFHDVAHATSSLAASQAVRWGAHEATARRHLEQVQTLADRCAERPGPAAPAALVGFGTDLGLCGRLNHAVAERLVAALEAARPALVLPVGRRLADALGGLAALEEPAPASVEAAQDLCERLLAEVRRVCGPGPVRLGIVRVDARGVAGTSWGDEAQEHAGRRAGASPPLLPPAAGAPRVAADLLLGARLMHAACAAALGEARVRQETMRRARETAERRIAEQERLLRRARQERITQEMLEARAGRGARPLG